MTTPKSAAHVHVVSRLRFKHAQLAHNNFQVLGKSRHQGIRARQRRQAALRRIVFHFSDHSIILPGDCLHATCTTSARVHLACFSALWIQSFEHDDALREIAQLCREQSWRLATWDIEQGLQVPGQNTGQSADAGGGDPLAAIRSINALASADSSAVLVLTNFHRFLSSPEIVQALARQITVGKQNRTFVVVLLPVVTIPVELEKLFAVIEHDLPGRQQIEEIARGVATEEGELPDGVELDRVLDAAAGLTRYEAENAFSLSSVRHRRIEPESIWELKAGMLKKSGLLQLYRGGERFENLGGLESLKAFCLRAMRNQGNRDPRQASARGVYCSGFLALGKAPTQRPSERKRAVPRSSWTWAH